MSPLLLHRNINQYKWFALYLHRDVSHTYMLQPHFISFRGGFGAGGNMRGSRNFCQFYLILSLFYSLQRGSNGFIAEKTILILYQGSRGGPLCPGGVSNLFQVCPNANFYRNPYTYLLFITFFFGGGGGGVRNPYPPLHPHMGNVIVTGQCLSQSRFSP